MTSKIVDERGCVVQTVRIQSTVEQRQAYANKIEPRINAVVGWLHKRELIMQGHLTDEDIPSWVSREQAATLKSRFQLFAAHEKRVKTFTRNDDDVSDSDVGSDTEVFGSNETISVKYNPLQPISVFKHAINQLYNVGKGGLDKSTQIRAKLLPTAPMPFEPKFIYIIQSCNLVNLWRVEQSIRIAKPYILSFREKNEGKNPTIQQLRTQLKKLPFMDFVHEFVYHCLGQLQQTVHESLVALLSPTRGAEVRRVTSARSARSENVVLESEHDCFIRETLEDRVRRGIWPLGRGVNNKVEVFVQDEAMNRVRQHDSCKYPRLAVGNGLKSSGQPRRLACVMCGDKPIVRNIQTQCKVCRLPLCTKRIKTDGVPSDNGEEADGSDANGRTCFELFHEAQDLQAAHLAQVQLLKSSRRVSRDSGRYEHSRSAAKRRSNPEADPEESFPEEEDDQQSTNATGGGAQGNVDDENGQAADGNGGTADGDEGNHMRSGLVAIAEETGLETETDGQPVGWFQGGLALFGGGSS